MASPFETTSAGIVTIDLTRHPPNHPLGMLLAPGAGGGAHNPPPPTTTTTGGGGETFGNYFSTHNAPPSSSSSSPTSSNVTLVAGWEHGNGGLHLGPIQRSGLVRLGDRLVRINGKDVTDWTFREVMDALKELVSNSASLPATGSANTTFTTSTVPTPNRRRLKTLGFAPSGTPEWSRGTHHPTSSSISESMFFGLFHQQQQHQQSSNVPSAHVVHSKRHYSFVSFIGRWRVVASDSLLEHDNGQQQRQRQQRRQHSEHSNEDGQQQPRQHSENSSCELERQLNKEPSIQYDDRMPTDNDDPPLITTTTTLPPRGENDDTTNTAAAPTTTSSTEKKPYIQYEIQCHILFRDPSSFQSHTTHHHPPYGNTTNNNNNNNNPNNTHHSWSVWKRYSELQTLDEELRRDFGWQMDALDDGRGVIFPRSHGLESWWYGFRGGGNNSGNKEDDKVEEGGYWGTGSLYGLFRTAGSSNNINGVGDTTTATKGNDPHASNSSSIRNSNHPFPPSFLQKRQKELSSYWTNLMRIEDIFEFSDVHSHKFGKAMAAFLEVDDVLLSRKSGGAASSLLALSSSSGAAATQHHHHHHQQQHQQHLTSSLLSSSNIAFPAINENESTEMFGSFRPSSTSFVASSSSSAREVVSSSGLLMTIHDDDVSILSDGTGAFGDTNAVGVSHDGIRGSSSILGGRPVVDIVPQQYSNGGSGVSATGGGDDGEGNNNGMIGNSTTEKQLRRSSTSSLVGAHSSSSVASGRRGRGRVTASAGPRAKPAFQRQFVPP